MRSLALVVVTACHSPTRAPAPPPIDRACADALPTLAQQHTRNVTQLYIAPFELAGGTVKIGSPTLATTKRGYVNQASFAADGRGLFFTWRPENSQADIWFHDLRTGAERPVTCTSEEEYNATQTRDGFVVLRVEPDLSRKLVRLDATGRVRDVLFSSVANLGAYLWIDDDTAVLFVGDATGSKLLLGHVHTGAIEPIAENVSAAMAAIPGTHAISFVDRSDDKQARLMRFDLDTRAITPILPIPDEVERLAWLADDTVLYGDGTKLVRASLAQPIAQEVIDLRGQITGTITRVTVGAGRVAFVVHTP